MQINQNFLILKIIFIPISFFSIFSSILNNKSFASDNFQQCQRLINKYKYQRAAAFCLKAYDYKKQTFDCLKGNDDWRGFTQVPECKGKILKFKSTPDKYHFLGHYFEAQKKFKSAYWWYGRADKFWDNKVTGEKSMITCDSDPNCFHNTEVNRIKYAETFIKYYSKNGGTMREEYKALLEEYGQLKEKDKNAQYGISSVYAKYDKGEFKHCNYLSKASKLGHQESWWLLREYKCTSKYH